MIKSGRENRDIVNKKLYKEYNLEKIIIEIESKINEAVLDNKYKADITTIVKNDSVMNLLNEFLNIKGYTVTVYQKYYYIHW